MGKVIGIDFTPAMVDRAIVNAEKLGFKNVEFRQGDIENMPLASNVADVVVSNCVLNLVPNKEGVFKEIYRVLKPGGHFSISDIVLIGDLPDALRKDAEMYAGCVSGAIQKDIYLELIHSNGFKNVTIQKEKSITIPDDILQNYLNEEELNHLNRIVTQYLEFAELQALQRKPMHMKDWIEKLHSFLTLNDREILNHSGKISHEDAEFIQLMTYFTIWKIRQRDSQIGVKAMLRRQMRMFV